MLFLLAAFTFRAAAATFTASLEHATISVGDASVLTLVFEGGKPSHLPTMPSVPNLRILGPQSEGSSAFIANGQASTVYTYSYALLPSQAGDFVIPELTTDVGGVAVKSAPVNLKVLPANVKPPPPPAPKTAFLRIIVPKTNLFLGEILPMEIQICFLNVHGQEAPHFKEEGFTIGKITQSGQNVTLYNNQRYNTVSFSTYVVPVKAGKITLGPATMPVQIPRPTGQSDFFGRPVMDWQNTTLESEAYTINVQPLRRDNVPASFNGAVGNFTLALEASPTNVAVGDPITVKVQIAGKGGLDGISLPTQTGWDQFKLYPPTSEVQTTDNLGMTGTKTFKLTAVPQNMDIKELPAYVFSYFDPELKSYRTLTQPALPLTLRPSAASLPPTALTTPSSSAENAESSQGILSIKQRIGTLAQIQPPIAVRGWFIFAQIIPLLVWLGFLLRRKAADRLAANPQLRRQRLVDRIVREGLKKLKQAAQENDAETFFATAFHLLQEQIGERLDRPASAITEAVLDEPVLAARLPEETRAAMHDLFHTFNQARYAPQNTNAELVSLAVTVEDALNILKQLKA